MSHSLTDSELTEMLRNFMRSLKKHLTAKALEGETEEVVERLLAAIAAIAAAILMAIPRTRKSAWVGSLLAIALRLFNKKESNAQHASGPNNLGLSDGGSGRHAD